MVTIERAIEGVSLNGKEMLLDEHGNPMLFGCKKLAINFLQENGYENLSNEEFEDTFFFEEYKKE